MSNSRKNDSRKASRWSQWLGKRSQLKSSLRRPVVETLEDRRLMAATPYTDGLYYPTLGKYAGRPNFLGGVSGAEYARRSDLTNGLGGADVNSGPEGLGTATLLSAIEIEPNATIRTAQLLPLGTAPGNNQVITVAGTMTALPNVFDEDYYAVDLRAGDIIDAQISTAFGVYDLSLNDAIGNPIAVAQLPTVGYYPPSSPLSTTGSASFSYVIPTTGRYYFRVSDGAASYSLKLQAFRSTYEAETVGTKQILFLDFDGAAVRTDVFGVPGTARLASLEASVLRFGLTTVDINPLINKIIAGVTEDYLGSLPTIGKNGYYSADGIPGHFDIEIRNSRDHADPWGLPNVSRVIVGGDAITSRIGGVLGIAQSGGDVGNFAREETALVLPGEFVGYNLIPRSPTTTYVDVLGIAIANTVSHEAGHFFGAFHTEQDNLVFNIMDTGNSTNTFSNNQSVLGYGLDGIVGNADDIDVDFGVDNLENAEFPLGGLVDNAAVIAFGLSTGLRGGFITGTTYNDRNRNGLIGSGEEGLVGQLVFADYNVNGIADTTEPRAISGAGGAYRLTVAPGTWQIRSTAQTNWQLTGAAFQTVTVGLDQTVSNINFGQILPNQFVTGFKYADTNGNGIRDAGELGLGGFFIYIDLDGDDRIDIGEPSARTAADGSFSLNPPTTGTYAIREVLSPGYVQTFPVSGEHIVTFNGTPIRGIDFLNQPARDYGDAPAPYPTLIAQNGANHGFDPNLFLGTNVDFDANGNPNATANGDDIAGRLDVNGVVIDDEEGVVFARPIVANDTQNLARVTVRNATGSTAYLSGWIDFNQDGDWSDAGEKILSDVQVTTGRVDQRFIAPSDARLGNTFARFRLSQTLALGVTGAADSGEVEDYLVNVTDREKYAIDDTFSVPRSSTGNVFDVQANDFMRTVPGEGATITAVTQGTQGGSVSISSDGSLVIYTPRNGFTGSETFRYTVLTSTGKTDTATVTVSTIFRLVDPVAIDDSYDLPSNSVAFPLNVLANDLEGVTGALQVISVTNPDKGGIAVIGQGGLSIRYTPRAGFGGTEFFRYTVQDAAGKIKSANITVHTLDGDRADDKVEISLTFTDLLGNPIPAVRQGDKFQLHVAVTDLRNAGDIPSPGNPGVFAAYLDLLYNSNLVSTLPGIAGTGFDFDVTFFSPYNQGRLGSAENPGLISQLGAATSSSNGIAQPPPVRVATLTFEARSAGIADFATDPAEPSPTTDVLLFSEDSPVPKERVRYRRASIEIVPNSVEFPFAVDDSLPTPLAVNSFVNAINVLANDRTGNSPPVTITNIGQPLNGSASIDNNGTPSNSSDDRVLYTPNPNFQGTDQFTYTIRDSRGFQSSAKVTVQVGNATADDVVQFRLEATNLSGQPIEQIQVGQKFQLRGFVKQLLPLNGGQLQGVYAAYQDILYNPALATVSPIVFNNVFGTTTAGTGEYPNAPAGDLAIPGLINELGSVSREVPNTINFPGPAEKLQFIIELTANAAGTLTFVGDPADISPFHDSLVFDPTTVLQPSQIRYISDTITIGNIPAGEGFTNSGNRFDVNNDGFTSPIDALIIINSLGRGGSRALSVGSGEGESAARMFIDVNGDGFISPLDALQVINALNRNRPSAAGEGEGSQLAISKNTVVDSSLDFESAIDMVAEDIASLKRRRG